MKEIELIEKRNRKEKHFLQEDGTIIAKIYNDDIHFLKNGKFEEIDNTLVKKNGFYINKNNQYKVSINEDTKNGLMKLEEILTDAKDVIKLYQKNKTNPVHFPNEENLLRITRGNAYRHYYKIDGEL